MKFEDYTKYILKHIWLKLPYHKPVKALLVGVEFENERINVRYVNKYKQEMVQFVDPDDIITPEQYRQLHLPKLWDKNKENVTKQTDV